MKERKAIGKIGVNGVYENYDELIRIYQCGGYYYGFHAVVINQPSKFKRVRVFGD